MSLLIRTVSILVAIASFGISAEVMEYKLSDGRTLVGEKQGDTIVVTMGKSKMGVKLSPGITVVEENPVKNNEADNEKVDQNKPKTKQEQKQDEINDLLGQNKRIEFQITRRKEENIDLMEYIRGGYREPAAIVGRSDTKSLDENKHKRNHESREAYHKGVSNARKTIATNERDIIALNKDISANNAKIKVLEKEINEMNAIAKIEGITDGKVAVDSTSSNESSGLNEDIEKIQTIDIARAKLIREFRLKVYRKAYEESKKIDFSMLDITKLQSDPKLALRVARYNVEIGEQKTSYENLPPLFTEDGRTASRWLHFLRNFTGTINDIKALTKNKEIWDGRMPSSVERYLADRYDEN